MHQVLEYAYLQMKQEGKDLMKNIVDTADSHGNTLLSEAAAGGAKETVQYLLQRQVDSPPLTFHANGFPSSFSLPLF